MVAFWMALVADPGMSPSTSGAAGFAVGGHSVGIKLLPLDEIAATRALIEGRARRVHTAPGFA